VVVHIVQHICLIIFIFQSGIENFGFWYNKALLRIVFIFMFHYNPLIWFCLLMNKLISALFMYVVEYDLHNKVLVKVIKA